MKNYPYNTGRTVTINLDTLGNADLWQIFTIVTDGTYNIWQGEEEGASPKADPDAATEIFLHIAETADDRTAGYCDAAQRDFLLGIKADYIDTFDTDPADDLRKRLEIEKHEDEPDEEEPAPTKVTIRATPGNFHEPDEEEPAPAAPTDLQAALRESDEDYRIWDDALIWLDGSPKAHDGWRIVEEAARIASTAGYKTNIHTAGRVYGMATALEVTARIKGADADWWLGFIEDFAEGNYEDGARIEE